MARHKEGKKLTYPQRSLMRSHGIHNAKDWLYMGTEVSDKSGAKRLSKNDPKESVMVFRNVITNEEKRIVIE